MITGNEAREIAKSYIDNLTETKEFKDIVEKIDEKIKRAAFNGGRSISHVVLSDELTFSLERYYKDKGFSAKNEWWMFFFNKLTIVW